MREAGLIVNMQVKIHIDPDIVCPEVHSIIDPNSGLHIQTELYDIFSGFYTRAPTVADTIQDDITVINISPDRDSWNPYLSHYGENKKIMIHSFCNIMNKEYAVKTIF